MTCSNQGKDVVLVSSGAIATGVAALGLKEKPTELKGKTGMCGSRTGQTDDDLSETCSLNIISLLHRF